MNTRNVLLSLLLVIAGGPVWGADGFMVRVTASEGQVKDGDKVLATVPRGTRMWCFEVKDDGWAKVKAPEVKEYGWIDKTQFEKVELTDAQRARNDIAFAHYEKYQQLAKDQKLQECLVEIRECLAIVREVFGEDHPYTATLLCNLGSVVRYQTDYSAARRYYEEALAIYRNALGDEHPDTATTISTLGGVANEQRDYAAARAYLNEALATCRNNKEVDPDVLAGVLCGHAYLSSAQDDYRTARSHLEEALSILRKAHGDDSPSLSWVLQQLATLHLRQGDYVLARQRGEQALALVREVEGGSAGGQAAEALWSLAHISSGLGDHALARKYAEESLAAYRTAFGDGHRETAQAYCALGRYLTENGDLVAARKCYEDALAIERRFIPVGRAHNPHLPCTLQALGELCTEEQAFDEARRYLEESYELYLNDLGEHNLSTYEGLASLGDLDRVQGRYREATQKYERALTNYLRTLGLNHPSTARTLKRIAESLASAGRTSDAAERFDQASRSLRDHQVHILPALSEKEQLLFMKADMEGLALSLSFGWQQANDPRIAALSAGWLLNGKAVAQEALAESALLSSADTAPLVERLRSVRSRLAQLSSNPSRPISQQEISQLELEQQQLVRQVSDAGTGTSFADPWTSLAALRGELEPGSVLVSIARFKRHDFAAKTPATRWQGARYTAWVIPAIDEGTVRVVDLGDADAIDQDVSRFQGAIAKYEATIHTPENERAGAAIQEALLTLSQAVWEPLAKTLTGKRDIVLSPDGSLWLVPWAALPVEDGSVLLENYNISYLSSGRELVQPRQERTGIGPPVAMANPDFDLASSAVNNSDASDRVARRSASSIHDVPRLPGTAREVMSISAALSEIGHGNVTVYTDDLATESQFKQLYRPRVLVCSTHGFFLGYQEPGLKGVEIRLPSGEVGPGVIRADDGEPLENPLLRCGLLLAGCNSRKDAVGSALDDGVLTGLEIVGTDLRGTDLVVLSACDSGVGEVRSGEGVAGLRQAFQLAGAEAVLATLWRIPDQETVQIMTDFFVYLSKGKSKSVSLRAAQLTALETYRKRYGPAHPYYWAAFTLTGKE